MHRKVFGHVNRIAACVNQKLGDTRMPLWVLPVFIVATWIGWWIWADVFAAQRTVADSPRSNSAEKRGGTRIATVLGATPLLLWLVAEAINKFVDPWGTYIVGGGHLISLVFLCFVVARDVRRMHRQKEGRSWLFLVRTAYRRQVNEAKYDELRRYPALMTLGRKAGMERLEEYKREERRTCDPSLRFRHGVLWVFCVMGYLGTIYLEHHGIVSGLFSNSTRLIFLIALYSLGSIASFMRTRRFNRFMDAKVAEELNGGRWWVCTKCGYDLRASKDHCPECGESTLVFPTSKAL